MTTVRILAVEQASSPLVKQSTNAAMPASGSKTQGARSLTSRTRNYKVELYDESKGTTSLVSRDEARRMGAIYVGQNPSKSKDLSKWQKLEPTLQQLEPNSPANSPARSQSKFSGDYSTEYTTEETEGTPPDANAKELLSKLEPSSPARTKPTLSEDYSEEHTAKIECTPPNADMKDASIPGGAEVSEVSVHMSAASKACQQQVMHVSESSVATPRGRREAFSCEYLHV